jgi:serine/threonine protein kinase/Tol biopolymer transport system component
MTSDRWRQVEQIFQLASAQPASQREKYLRDACGPDSELRAEVERMLAGDADGVGNQSPPADPGTPTPRRERLTPGTQIGPYQISVLLGAGGMGEVYKARDTRLNRDVALKVLPQYEANDTVGRQRLLQEARTASALNHPNIVAVHDILSVAGQDSIVMEYVEGLTLEAVIGRKGLPIRDVLRYGGQIAGALAAAHDAGIIHRDLKPGNVMVSKGVVKVVDFGLAKTVRVSPNAVEATQTLTAVQVIAGTLPYMAPEQMSGGQCDARSDIFSLGLILYEMLAGRRAFGGASREALMAEVLRCEPVPLSDTPVLPTRVMERCLAKNPAERWQSARDLQSALELAGTVTADRLAPRTQPRMRWLLAVVTLVLISIILVLFKSSGVVREPVAFTIPPPEGATLEEWPGVPSPDGRLMAFVAKDVSGKVALWLRPLATHLAQALPGTDNASGPFWSPDGQFLGFFAQGKLKKIAAGGGPVQNVCNAAVDLGATWSSSGDIVMSPSNRVPLYRVPASGGTPIPITSLNVRRGENSHRWPHFLPDGRHFLFTARSSVKENSAVYVGSLDSKETRRLIAAQSNAKYAAPGLLLFGREGTLMAQPFDLRKQALDGEAFPVAGGVNQILPSENTLFSVSANGRVLSYRMAEHTQAQLVWFDRSGTKTVALGAPGEYTEPRLSPDGKRVALTVADPESGNRDIWLMETASGRSTRFTSDPANDWQPSWSPDGLSIAFASDRVAPSKIYRKASNGTGEEELVLGPPEGGVFPKDWSRDDRLLFNQSVGMGDALWIVSLLGDRTAHVFDSGANTSDARFSPDSKWVAYTSAEGGPNEVFVKPAAGGEKTRVSTAGGGYATWLKRGREIAYVAPDDFLMSVEVTPGKTFEVGTPKRLFRMCRGAQSLRGAEMFYDVASDGERFLVNCAATEAKQGAIYVSLDWQSRGKE